MLADHPGVTNVVVVPGAGQQPPGDLVLADVAREAASEVLEELRDLGLEDRGSVAVESVDLSLSRVAARAKEEAPGEGSDAIVWEDLQARTREESSLSGAYLVLFAVATTLAGIAVLLDSAILVIGAMIVGPEFGALAGVCAGVVLGRWDVVRQALAALIVGFGVALAYGLERDPAEPRSRYLDQAWTSTEQLLLNLLGIVLAGSLTLAVQHRLGRRRRRKSQPARQAE